MAVMNGFEKKLFNRGNFLRLCTRSAFLLAGGLGLAGLVRYFSHSPGTGKQTRFDLGPEDAFPESGKLLRLDIPAVIYRTPGGYRSYSLVCTHLGCMVEESEGGYSCPCHGSRFAEDGRVMQGPAVDKLPELELALSTEGNLLLDTAGGKS